MPTDSFLRLSEVCDMVALTKSTIYREIKKGEFPKPRRLTAATSAWLRSEIEGWMNSRKVVQ